MFRQNYYAFYKLMIRMFSWAPNQHVRMISVLSCDIKYWSNGCWKFSFAITKINNILIYIQIDFFLLFYNITVLLFYPIT